MQDFPDTPRRLISRRLRPNAALAERSLAVLGSCYNYGWARLPAALLASALFVVSANRHRLQRRFDQTECDTQVVQPVLDFLFHGAPFWVVPSDRNSVAASH
ncbi:Secreted protein [Pseudomonas sp. IT-P253]